MSPQELIKKCNDRINMRGDDTEIMLVIPGRWGKRDYKTLLGVRGEIVQEFEREIAVMFPVRPLLEAAIRELEKGGCKING